jgi:hopanoid biosynthesis associated protein HpnK
MGFYAFWPSPLRSAKGALKRIIITGDDFGLALPVNKAIEEAHLKGVLTTASLMVGAKFAGDAAERSRNHPSLKVGLHLTLVEGSSVLPPQRIPDLVDASGSFPTHLTRAGFKFFFYPGIRKQLEGEIRAQFDAFHKTGFVLDHVNAHNHMHLHPTVLRLILKVGRDYGLKAIRLPNEPPLRSWQAARASLGSRFASWIFLFPWLHLMKGMMRRANVRHNDFLFGMNDSGAMTLDLALRLVQHLPDGATELCFHPAVSRCAEIDSTMPGYRHEDELRALTSEALIHALNAKGLKTIAFSDL